MTEETLIVKKQDSSLKLFVVLAKAYRAIIEQAEMDIKSKGLNLTDFAVLELLFHRGKQPMQKIGDKILMTSGSITYIVNKLEKKGYLVREASPNDRRVTYASISDQGRELLNSIFPAHWEKLKTIMNGLNDEEKDTAIELLKKLGTTVKKI
ncbi:MarR family transcriptional regulator [Oceanobacillus profundus]|uniref:MarR family winged helix-turn-helix transcriptional regulator n=1 Tax=Oceanobacillus TaxID=182709 RepID=UPI00203D3EBA|nr:MarR family transcriptional regulator [Oceanobacillus profundus]MCM3399054.1 MarR family transcriptional regulator [Oceanobacillus profundus]MDO6450586.1 MarR family transcriptional regulator [Oceanobacillus profundus]